MTNPSYVLSFVGPMRMPATTVLRNACCEAVNGDFGSITILFASEGGSVEDGLALYEFLRCLPIPLHMHAVGLVASIAVPVFLAADTRSAAATARFLFHGYTWTYVEKVTLSTDMMADHSFQIAASIERAKSVIQVRTQESHSPTEISQLFSEPRIVDPTYALERRLIHKIEEFRLPAGTRLLNAAW